jgi:hypothetical protein
MRLASLWCLFFVICFGLGYPTLNRYDPQKRDIDTVQYRDMVIHGSKSAPPHFAHRVLIPYAAHPFFILAESRVGSWDAGYFGLLVVNSLLVSGAAALLFVISSSVSDINVGLLTSALYLLNFAVSNLLLIGFVDSGEAFCLMVLIWAAMTERWWVVPFAIVPGVLAKETFLLFAAVFCATWAVSDNSNSRLRKLLFTGIGIALGLAALAFASKATSGSMFAFAGGEVNLDGSKLKIALAALTHRDFWLAFMYLAPLGFAGLNKMPKAWRHATATSATLSLLLVIYHAGASDAGPELVRPLFSVAGPLLTCSMALFIVRKMNPLRDVLPSRN